MIGDGPEVQSGAEARKVARIGKRMGTVAAEQRETRAERVVGQRGMHVQVAEQYLAAGVGTETLACRALLLYSPGHDLVGYRHCADDPGSLVCTEPPCTCSSSIAASAAAAMIAKSSSFLIGKTGHARATVEQ